MSDNWEEALLKQLDEAKAEIKILRAERDAWKELSERFRAMTPWADESEETDHD